MTIGTPLEVLPPECTAELRGWYRVDKKYAGYIYRDRLKHFRDGKFLYTANIHQETLLNGFTIVKTESYTWLMMHNEMNKEKSSARTIL